VRTLLQPLRQQQIAEHFHVRRTADNVGVIAPNYNVAPGDPQPVIRRSRDTGERELVLMRWCIVPCSPRAIFCDCSI
jgi:putative SOS response-associated peptidase YedK